MRLGDWSMLKMSASWLLVIGVVSHVELYWRYLDKISEADEQTVWILTQIFNE